MKMMNPYFHEEETVFFETDKYVYRKDKKEPMRLYVELFCIDKEFGYPEPYADVTVNIPDYPLSDENCAFLDTNNAPFVVELLTKYNCGKFTGRYAYSGYCAYPEFRFDMETLNKYTGIESVEQED